jgi:outer membrane protein OmpA-like peptidoglycan-associated protein
VAVLLTKGGIASNRIDTDGLGQADPLAPNDTEAGRARNRRLVLVVIQK